MDINKVQKLNRLALDLKKYNLGNDNSDNSAVSAAEKIYGEENNYMSKHNSLEKKDENMENYDREIRNLSIAVKNNEEKSNQIISKINEMIKEFNELKESVKTLRGNIEKIQAGRESLQQPTLNTQPHSKKDPASENTQAEKKKEAPIDRNGVAPSSISIDKYFYCGKK